MTSSLPKIEKGVEDYTGKENLTYSITLPNVNVSWTESQYFSPTTKRIYLSYDSENESLGYLACIRLRSLGFIVRDSWELIEKFGVDEMLNIVKNEIEEADMMIAIMNESRPDIIIEVFYAYQKGKKVYILTKNLLLKAHLYLSKMATFFSNWKLLEDALLE